MAEFGPWRNGVIFGNVSQGCQSFYSGFGISFEMRNLVLVPIRKHFSNSAV